MPKIRLSALATDMKGKSGGSVFSTNAGGTYFRNNPSGTSSKKPSNSQRKQQFATLSQAWRQLTPEQQTAWADAGILYPTTNAWGEPRIPKGFELFMRLNSNLININHDPLVIPVAPRSFPAIPTCNFDYIDKFQLIPVSAFQCLSLTDSTVRFYPTIAGYFSSDSLDVNKLISFRTNIHPPRQKAPYNPATILLFTLVSSGGVGMSISLMGLLTPSPTISVQFSCSTGQLTRTYNISQEDLLSDIHLAYQLQSASLETGILYINGLVQIPSDFIDGTLSFDVFTADLVLNSTENPIGSPLLLSDFRIYNEVFSSDVVQQIAAGYVQNSEQILIPMNILDGDTFRNYTTIGDSYPMTINPPTSLRDVMEVYTFKLLPIVYIEISPTIETGFLMKMLVTEFVSIGKATVSNVFKLCSIEPWNATDIRYPLRARACPLFSTVGGASLSFRVQMVDSTTGATDVTIDVPVKSPRPRPRFKAGAELSGKVN